MKWADLSLLAIFFMGPPVTGEIQAEDGQTFAIQNIANGKSLRSFEAAREDGNTIILYDHHFWRCLTWSFKKVGPNRYRLTNYYTGKFLDVKSAHSVGVLLVQHEIVSDSLAWDFEALPGGSYAIRMAGSDLYITTSSTETNTPLTLSPFASTESQKWRLIPQRPWF